VCVLKQNLRKESFYFPLNLAKKEHPSDFNRIVHLSGEWGFARHIYNPTLKEEIPSIFLRELDCL
jgi:hypothetical protein